MVIVSWLLFYCTVIVCHQLQGQAVKTYHKIICCNVCYVLVMQLQWAFLLVKQTQLITFGGGWLLWAHAVQRGAAIFWSMVERFSVRMVFSQDPDGWEQFGTAWYFHRVTDKMISPTLTSRNDTGLTNPSNLAKFTPKTQTKLTLKWLKNKKVNGPELNPNKNLCNYLKMMVHKL